MTVAQLIEELQKCPGHAPVSVSVPIFLMQDDGSSQAASEEKADIERVSWEGNHVLIERTWFRARSA